MKFLPVGRDPEDDGDVIFGGPGSDSIGGGAGDDVDEVETVA